MSLTLVYSRPERPRARVLFIDGDLDQLDLYSLVVERCHEVLKATRAETGFELACQARPDVIVIDAALPDVDGLDLCVRFWADPRTTAIPIVVVTGDEVAYERADGLRFRLAALVKKPCSADQLLAILAHAVVR